MVHWLPTATSDNQDDRPAIVLKDDTTSTPEHIKPALAMAVEDPDFRIMDADYEQRDKASVRIAILPASRKYG
jgi:hypothetical protein